MQKIKISINSKYICSLSLWLALLLPTSAWTSSDDVPEVAEPSLQQELQADLPENDDAQVQTNSYNRKDGTIVEEYSLHGKVYMLRVKPAGDAPAYYLYDQDGDGNFEQRLPGGIKRLSPPTWVIKTF
ncbi:MAG: DUF2782 domain-containing protein [Mariprofundales bacterium]